MTSSRGLAFCLCLISGLLISSGTVNGAIVNLVANIDGPSANAGAGTGSSGVGTTTLTFDDATNLLSWSGVFSGLTNEFTVAHFHGPALPSQNAGVQVAITVVTDIGNLSGTFNGSATISAPQASDLLNDLWYINIHSQFAPGGEIRGQVITIPEPTSALFLGCTGALACLRRRRS